MAKDNSPSSPRPPTGLGTDSDSPSTSMKSLGRVMFGVSQESKSLLPYYPFWVIGRSHELPNMKAETRQDALTVVASSWSWRKFWSKNDNDCSALLGLFRTATGRTAVSKQKQNRRLDLCHCTTSRRGRSIKHLRYRIRTKDLASLPCERRRCDTVAFQPQFSVSHRGGIAAESRYSSEEPVSLLSLLRRAL